MKHAENLLKASIPTTEEPAGKQGGPIKALLVIPNALSQVLIICTFIRD